MLLLNKTKQKLSIWYICMCLYTKKNLESHVEDHQHYLPIGERKKKQSNFQLELYSDCLTVVVVIFIGPCRKKIRRGANNRAEVPKQ